MTTEIVEPRTSTQLARLDPQALIVKAIEAKADIDTMERLVALAKDIRAIQAKEAYLDAMAQFHEKCPPIYKSKRAKMPRYSYTYAPLDEICSTIDPILGELGLSKRWTTPKIEADKVTVACIISHALGHSESSGDLEMPVMAATQRQDGGEGGANAAQRVGISLTYAKRYSLLGILGLAPEDDDDGAPPTDERREENGEQQPDGVISEPQAKRFWAIAREHKWTDEQVKDLLTSFRRDHTKDVLRSEYDRIIDKLKAGPGK